MSYTVDIKKGFYRGEPVQGVFQLVEAWKQTSTGGHVKINNPNPKFGTPPVQRITCLKEDVVYLTPDGHEVPAGVELAPSMDGGARTMVSTTNYEALYSELETEDEAMDRIAGSFLMLDRMTDACCKGNIRGIVVSGPPGVGKSFGVEKQLEVANIHRREGNTEPNYEILSGVSSPIGLYETLWNNKKKGRVLILDDSDGCLFEEDSATLLKAALNSGDRRIITWNKNSRLLDDKEIDKSFQFDASIMFISNIDFEEQIERSSRIAAHLRAIMDRCHYMDLEIGSVRDRMLRIKQIVRDGMLTPYGFSKAQEKAMMDWVSENAEFMREVSLREVKKIADFVKTDPKDWAMLSEATLLRKEAKFKRLYDHKMSKGKKAK